MNAHSGGPPKALEQSYALKARTKNFAIRIVKLYQSLRTGDDARVIGRQLLRSGTSVAANYRAVCRARSKAEFVSRMGSLSRRLTKQCCGWSFWWTAAFSRNRACETY